MVLWCKSCGAFLGMREPNTDWTDDRTTLCSACTGKDAELLDAE